METVSEDSRTARTDPIRVIEAVVAGMAFLGAGAIIQARGSVRGITTGTSIWIWLVGTLGLACGGGYYAIALIKLILAFTTLTVISYIETKIHLHLLGNEAGQPETAAKLDRDGA